MPDLMSAEWKWHWRKDGDEADCGIFAETRIGHGYAVARCPRYLTKDQWTAIATRICDLHNADIARAALAATMGGET